MNQRGLVLRPFLTERVSLEKSHHATIDFVLKDLKLFSRRLSTVSTALADETQILDRLHYKNKNQHRSALFSRRVSELRRYSHRVEKLNICGLVDDVRQCFFGATEGFNSKQMKGSWSYFPDERYVSWVREQLSSFSVLSNKMYAISCAAFKSFSLFMQTGAFIQLILTLIAITSRLAMLAAEMNEILQLAIPAIDRLFAVFKPSADTEENKEAIFEPTPITTATSGSMPKVEFREASPPPRSGKPTIERKVVKRSNVQHSSEDSKERPRKKRKEKKDEIDDIFGF